MQETYTRRYHPRRRGARLRSGIGDHHNLSGLIGANGAPVAAYTEGGFTVATTLGQFFQGQIFGNPIPSLFAGPAQGGPADDALDIIRNGGGSFNFASVDLAANNGDVDFHLHRISGWRSAIRF
jgi:hypothetical protein